MADYSQIDNFALLGFLLYPRGDYTPCPKGASDFFIPVAENY